MSDLSGMFIVSHMTVFKRRGLGYLNSLPENMIVKMIQEANTQYHNYQLHQVPPILTDSEYDIVKEYCRRHYPNASVLQEIGSKITGKQKTLLPVPMPSMDKIKPDTNALAIWCKKYTGPYVLSCKLDGISGLYDSQTNLQTETSPEHYLKMYTRGDGTVGQDISHIIPFVSNLPKIPNLLVRGEFIVSKQNFESRYKSLFANSRNMMAGWIHRKTVDPDYMAHVHFVAYEVISPKLCPSDQMIFLNDHGFNTVDHKQVPILSNDFLSQQLLEWKESCAYEMDGVIVVQDQIPLSPRMAKNPEYAFAFKMLLSEQMVETEVVDVIWSPSKDGYLKPRIRVNPVVIGGSRIEYATGFNAQFIESNRVGIGAIVQLVRSGDVIPYIQAVTVPAEITKMPEIEYKWTDSHVDIFLTNTANNPIVLEKQIVNFFTTLNVDGLSSGNIRRIIQAGYNSIPKILHMTEADFLSVEGFQLKMSQKIFLNIHKNVETCSLGKMLVAGGCLGRGLGEKKVQMILGIYPDILLSDQTIETKMAMLRSILGIGEENAKMFVDHIPNCLAFLDACGFREKYFSSNTTSSELQTTDMSNHPLYQKKILFTGFRDKELMSELETTYKANLVSSISKQTDYVVIKSMAETNSKIEQARKWKIPTICIDEFRNML
jgi:DNA ligase (NAD+)